MRVTVENFQSIAQAVLDIERLTVLVGPSDRGKSSVIRALEGALFNRPGETFVRSGAQIATVTIEWRGHTITWRKGAGKNEFEIDGTLYSKVGVKAPPALLTLGFREELIGARLIETEGGVKAEGGTWVRPQVARQFDPIFLLQESGTFLNEVIVKLSRLGVLQRAGRQCAMDLGSTKRALTVRRGDLETATAAAEQLAEAPLLRARLEALLQTEKEMAERARGIQALQGLIQKRRTVKARLKHALPVAVRTVQLNDEKLTVTALQEQYEAMQRSRESLLKRAALVALPAKLPKSKTALLGQEHKALEKALQRWQTLSTLLGGREMRLTALDAASRKVTQAEAGQVKAADAIERFRQETPFCPLCAQPWPQGHAHAVA